MASLQDTLARARQEGLLGPESADNIGALLAAAPDPLYAAVVSELTGREAWGELNDRFFKRLAFGTGGLRGRTIGRIVTKAERGAAPPDARPEHPCVGTNSMNFYNVSRATQGLVAYVQDWLASQGGGRARLAIAHDTRHFSREFAELAARVAVERGCDVFLFDGPRSTPELSFAVRQFRAHAGIMLTASHNPPHDNGYKVYFDDGAQIVEPHAGGIIARVNSIASEIFQPVAEPERGTLTAVGAEFDQVYLDRLQTLALRPEILRHAAGLKIVYSNLHGTGGVIIRPLLERLGLAFATVPAQDVPDGDFPTVESPNPENAPALRMAMDLADREGADLVLATDPDCDRMGVAVRDAAGRLQLITGNQIGSLLAHYRIEAFFDLGVLDPSNRERAVLIKTFVTTELQAAIARDFGVSLVNTLTGFKYIGAKLGKYERQIPEPERAGYRDRSEEETRALRLRHSRFFVFGGEESYGYLGADFVRDKDGNGAVLMFCELAAYAKSQGRTVLDLLDDLYLRHGHFEERQRALTFEGAEGAARIQRLSRSYAEAPPQELDGVPVAAVRDFGHSGHFDEEGDPVPQEAMLLVVLADGRRFAVRPSGTEPKIKFYLYGCSPAPASRAGLAEAKRRTTTSLDALWQAIESDIQRRLE